MQFFIKVTMYTEVKEHERLASLLSIFHSFDVVGYQSFQNAMSIEVINDVLGAVVCVSIEWFGG